MRFGAGLAECPVARWAALIARKRCVSVHETEGHAVRAAAAATDRARHGVIAVSINTDAELAPRKRVEARGRDVMALSLGRRDDAGPLGSWMVSADDFELTRVAMTPDGDNGYREPVDRAVSGDGVRQRLPLIQPSHPR